SLGQKTTSLSSARSRVRQNAGERPEARILANPATSDRRADAPLALKVTDEAVTFRSHLDGTLIELSPEKAVHIQENLGADIAMCLDECPSMSCEPSYWSEAVRRTLLWAERCRNA